MSEAGTWERLAIDPATATFPAPGTCGGMPIWIVQTSTGYRGIQAMCPHADQSLGSARVVGNGTMVRCAFHNYTFKLATGAGVNCPGYSIAVYDVRERDGALFVQQGIIS